MTPLSTGGARKPPSTPRRPPVLSTPDRSALRVSPISPRRPAPLPNLNRVALRSFRQELEASSLEEGTARVYRGALKNWVAFTIEYGVAFLPTADSLADFIAYMIRRIASVPALLSGLAYHFRVRMSNWDEIRNDERVKRVLTGALKHRHHAATQKLPLTMVHLAHFGGNVRDDSRFDDIAFVAILFTGFFGVMRLGELVVPSVMKFDERKVIRRDSATMAADSFSFTIPYTKVDHLFAGSFVSITRDLTSFSTVAPLHAIRRYLFQRDARFQSSPWLFVLRTGLPPTRQWFIDRLHQHCSSEYAGHSLRSGGATFLAATGVDNSVIQRLGRWKSDTFQLYIRSHASLQAAVQQRDFRLQRGRIAAARLT